MSLQSKFAALGVAAFGLVGCGPAGTVTEAETAKPAIIGEVGVSFVDGGTITTFTPANNPDMRCVRVSYSAVDCYPAPEAKSASAPAPQ